MSSPEDYLASLSDEDYQKIVKLVNDKVPMNLAGLKIWNQQPGCKLTIDSSEEGLIRINLERHQKKGKDINHYFERHYFYVDNTEEEVAQCAKDLWQESKMLNLFLEYRQSQHSQVSDNSNPKSKPKTTPKAKPRGESKSKPNPKDKPSPKPKLTRAED